MIDATGVRRRIQRPAVPPPSAAEVDRKYPPRKQRPPTFEVQPIIAFYIFAAAHTLAALYHPIQDCDEVFNYWEPTHYLNHGHGFQTWEYSPQYAIRSWTYAGIHAIFTGLAKIVPFGPATKTAEFYLLRIVLGLVCAACETRLFSKISATFNPRIAVTFLGIMATSPGMFHASISFLPSSFTMYTTMIGMAAFMDWRGGLRTAQGIFWIALGAILGWPFAAAMLIPFMIEEAVFASISDKDGMIDFLWRLLDGTTRSFILIGFQIALELFFYKKFTVVPFNIVWYNVFSGRGGPNLYGTEPWHFYLRNLALNFHVWLLLALVSMPLLVAQHFFRTKGATKASYIRGITFLSPFYVWLAIFSLQPHKEERFMYPAYPTLGLNAAMALHIILANLNSVDPKDFIAAVPQQIRSLAILAFVFATLALSMFRTVGTITAYHAPLSIYNPLRELDAVRSTDIVCLGKEWYRFPSHYFLPAGMHAKFIRSEFSGLLPGEFHEGAFDHGFGLFPGTWLEPPGMNDENREDLGKYTDVKNCNFLVDSHLPSTIPTAREIDHIHDTEHWQRVKCMPFLDTASTGVFGRLGWVPDLPFVPASLKRVYGEYCLLKRKKKPTAERRMDALPNIETLS